MSWMMVKLLVCFLYGVCRITEQLGLLKMCGKQLVMMKMMTVWLSFLFCRMWRIMKITVCISVQDMENGDNVCICARHGEW